MEGAETFFLSAACVFELNIIANNFIDGAVLADVGNVFISYAAGPDGYLIG